MSKNYTVQLVDTTYGRIVLDQVSASSTSAAETLAAAAPPVSGDNSGAGDYTAGQVIDQAQVLSVSGTDTSGNPIVGPSALPVVPGATVAPSIEL